MLTLHDGLFELVVLRDELISEDELEHALKEQSRRKKAGQACSLDELLVEMAMIDEAKAEELRARLDADLIPGYRLHDELGRGGMGTVYRATQLSMERQVAIKILSRRLSSDSVFCSRFLQEARNSAKLNHENIMGGIDCGAVGGIHYFVMELVDGESLADKIDRDGPLGSEEVLKILEQVARGLKHAHDNKIVHRDIKPENLMYTRDGVVKICDLGLAKPAVEAGDGTKSATCEGTPYYCAPEQALGRTDLDARADIYALGATCYHLLAGKVPFDGENARKILWHQVHSPFPSFSELAPELKPEALALLQGLIIKDRDSRVRSADEVLSRLAAMRETRPTAAPASSAPRLAEPSSSSPVLLVAGLLGLIVIVAGAALVLSNDPAPVTPPVTPPEQPVQPPPKNTSPTPPVRVVEPPPLVNIDTAPVKPPPPEPTALTVEEKQARLLLEEARRHYENNPKDVDGTLARLRDLRERFKDSRAAKEAEADYERLMKVGESELAKAFRASEQRFRDTLDKGLYREALGVLESFREGHDARMIQSFEANLKNLRQRAIDMARRELDALARQLEQDLNNPQVSSETLGASIDAYSARAPEDLAADIKALRSKLEAMSKQRELDQQVRGVLDSIRNALSAGDLNRARESLNAALGQNAFKDSPALKKAARDLEGIAVFWSAFDQSWASLKGKTQVFPERGVESPKATLKEYNPITLELQLKIYGRMSEQNIEVGELEAAFLVGLVPSPSDVAALASRIRFFMVRGLVDAAMLCLNEAKAAGAEDKELEAELAVALGEAREAMATRLVARAMDSSRPADDRVRSIQRLTKDLSETRGYRSNYDKIVEAWLAARAQVIVDDEPESLFAGKAKRQSQKSLKFRLEYEFDDPKQANDFVADKKTIGGSNVALKDNEMRINGRISHIARWEGGPLKLEIRLRVLNVTRPNINLMLSDQGGYTGCFVGIGSRMRADEVTIKKTGAKVKLPANLVADAEGADWGYAFADRRLPKIEQDRPIRYYLERGKRGTLEVKIGTKSVIKMTGAPRTDDVGAVGFYLDNAALVLEEVVFEGTADQAWALSQAATMAKAEAAAFPKPAPEKPSPPDKGPKKP